VERKKKSRKEVVIEVVERRGLVSFMNTTKWKELKKAVIEEMPFNPPYHWKLISWGDVDKGHPDAKDENYWDFTTKSSSYSGEDIWADKYTPEDHLSWDCFATPFWAIEWIRVVPKKQEIHRGRLVEPKISKVLDDATDQFVEILERYNIPYEEENGVYTIYGYRGA